MRIVYDCKDGCCNYVHPEFGRCDRGMIPGAVFDEDTNKLVPQDWTCPVCEGRGHTRKCLRNAEKARR